jgi:hypothetical protein
MIDFVLKPKTRCLLNIELFRVTRQILPHLAQHLAHLAILLLLIATGFGRRCSSRFIPK